jgi:hypothetical protein
MIYTDRPLPALRLSCLTDSDISPSSSWALGESYVRKMPIDDPKGTAKSLHPDMYFYFSSYPLNIDLLDLAREYLDHGDKIIFVEMQYTEDNSFNRELLKTLDCFTIDISDVPPGKMPVIDGKEIEPWGENLSEFTIINGKKEKLPEISDKR